MRCVQGWPPSGQRHLAWWGSRWRSTVFTDDPDLPLLHEDECVSNTQAHMEPDDYFLGVPKAAMSAVAAREAAHRQYAKSASRLCDMLFRPNRKETLRSCWPP